jgi:cystathionine beta-lyase
MNIETELIKSSLTNEKNSLIQPLYQTAIFSQPSANDFGEYDYTRSGNPTRSDLQEKLAKLDNGKYAFCFSTGMSAINTILRLLKPGDEIIINNDSYGGTYRLLENVIKKYNINIIFLDLTGSLGPIKLKEVISTKTKLVMIESPTNPLLKICDIVKLSEITHSVGALLSIDNTMMSPVLSNPLDLGADIVCHSLSKYICGHSDTMGGVVIVNNEKIALQIKYLTNAEGTALSPFDSWLILRGLKTMFLRVTTQQSNAYKIALRLEKNNLIKKVYYPGLESHIDYELHLKQNKCISDNLCSGGGIISFTTDNSELSTYIVNTVKIFKISVSFGSMESLISIPANMSHASIPKVNREFPDDLIRLSIGIENINDLINDIENAINSFINY